MARDLFCWRCDMVLPMLTEEEWSRIEPVLHEAIEDVKRYRIANGCSLGEALRIAHGQSALEAYYAMTGFRETNSNAIWHHRLSLYGPPCAACGKPLRTPRASLCAACGAKASVAGG
jgi:hypothetical protein